jgi:hypothetical protein
MIRLKALTAVPLILLGLVLTGCSEVVVHNLSELQVRVLVRVPDEARGHTRVVRPADTEAFFSTTGGRYTVTTLPDEEYRQLLLDLQAEVGRRLFEERATLSAADVGRLVETLSSVDSQLDRMGEEGASCQGHVPDFESVAVILTWDIGTSKWVLSCP